MSARDQEQILLCLKMNRIIERNMQVVDASGYTQTMEVLVSSPQDVLSSNEPLSLHFYSS